MTINGVNIEETVYWDAIAILMDDDIRVRVNEELAPCTKEEFLRRYLELDPDFEYNVLEPDFGFEK